MKIVITSFLLLLLQLTHAQSNEWTWMHGTATSSSSVYGTVTVPSSLNNPGGRNQLNMWNDNSGKIWLFGGDYSDAPGNIMWKYDPAMNQWAWMSGDTGVGTHIAAVYGTQGVPSATNTPGGGDVGGFTEWQSHDGFFWLLGGYGLNNIWKYDPSILQWTWVSGSGNAGTGSYGTLGVPDPTNCPPGRFATDATWVDAAGNLWLFGGQNTSLATNTFNDMWKFDISTYEWTWMNGSNAYGSPGNFATYQTFDPANSPPASGANYTTWVDNNGKFWLYGGNFNFNYLWKFDPDPSSPTYNQWAWMNGSQVKFDSPVFGTQCVEDVANQPSVQLELRARWTDDCGNLYMFGGGDNNVVNNVDPFNTLWKYNTASNKWSFLTGDNIAHSIGYYSALGVSSSSNVPPAMYGSASARTKEGLWIYGGTYNTAGPVNYDYEKDDLWLYRPEKPVAAYTPSATSGVGSLAVNFTDNSTANCIEIKSRAWDFGDGSTSTLVNPSHTFSAGTFNVKLVVSNCFAVKDSSIQTITVSSTLPIELLTFTASRNNSVVDLEWSTSSETNNDYFTIERTDSRNSSYNELERVKGAGTSSVPHYYNSMDQNPLSGLSYYRLKQTDFDGKYSYSSVIPVDFAANKKIDFNVFPNPAMGNDVTMQLSGLEQNIPVLVVISDVLGRVCYSKITMGESNGEVKMVLKSSEPLAEGVYVITASENNSLISKRLVINK